MFCRNCGTKLDDKANFCNRCGTRCVRPAPSVVKTAPIDQRLSYAEKERIMVMRVTIEDMQKFTALPYIWNSRITKYIDPSAHPFAYINLFGPNIEIAKRELEKMNHLLSTAWKCSAIIPKRISIPVEKIVFTPQKYHGHTRLMCTPYTFTGEPALYPVSLSFMTDLSNDSISTHGDLFYGQDGTIKKAEIFCWRKSGGYFFYYATVDGSLTLEKAEHDGSIIYKAPHILAREAQRIQEEKDFTWLQAKFPDKCPKSISSFRRMKTQNTKNYQALKQAAADLGRNI